MNIKAVLKNIKKNGIKKTYRTYVFRKTTRNNWATLLEGLTLGDDIKFEEICRRYIKSVPTDTNERKKYFKFMDEKEKLLKEEDYKKFDYYHKMIKRIYVKELIPTIYSELSKNPVQDKVIFMENGNSPSPTSHHISKVMKKEGKYEVHTTGLKLQKVSYLEYYENALSFIRDMSTAKGVFLSTANDLLSHFDVRPETKVIQLWHGVGVFKKVGWSTVDNNNFGKNRAERMEYDQYRNYSYVTIAAEEQSWIFEESMNIKKDSGIIVPIGVSRTDVFYNPEYIAGGYKTLHEAFPQTKGKKIILYAPTFRGATVDAQAPDRLDIDAFAKALGDEYILIIKHHGLSKNVPEIPEQWKETFAFDLGKKRILGIERLLSIADICITDYSSIAFEYAIMERPLIFFAYDIEDYIDKRGMYYDYDEITPGPVCKTNEEMIDYILNIEERFDKQEIIDFKNKYVNACDGHATERTIQLLEN